MLNDTTKFQPAKSRIWNLYHTNDLINSINIWKINIWKIYGKNKEIETINLKT